jgi:hypothetical protein
MVISINAPADVVVKRLEAKLKKGSGKRRVK